MRLTTPRKAQTSSGKTRAHESARAQPQLHPEKNSTRTRPLQRDSNALVIFGHFHVTNDIARRRAAPRNPWHHSRPPTAAFVSRQSQARPHDLFDNPAETSVPLISRFHGRFSSKSQCQKNVSFSCACDDLCSSQNRSKILPMCPNYRFATLCDRLSRFRTHSSCRCTR